MKTRSCPQLFPVQGITHISKELLGSSSIWMCEISFHQLPSWKEECSYYKSRGQYLGDQVSAPWQEGMWTPAWIWASQNSVPHSWLKSKACLSNFTLIPREYAIAPYYSYHVTPRGRWKLWSWLLLLWNRILISRVANAEVKVSSVQWTWWRTEFEKHSFSALWAPWPLAETTAFFRVQSILSGKKESKIRYHS